MEIEIGQVRMTVRGGLGSFSAFEAVCFISQ